MPIYELINPSDLYTFEAPDIEIAALTAISLSTAYGARCVDTGETTPVLIGWTEWLDARGMIGNHWAEERAEQHAASLESLILGTADERESLLAQRSRLTEAEWLHLQDNRRTSMSRISEKAQFLAQRIRRMIEQRASNKESPHAA